MLNPSTLMTIRAITTVEIIIPLCFFFCFFFSIVELGNPQLGQAENFISYSLPHSSHTIKFCCERLNLQWGHVIAFSLIVLPHLGQVIKLILKSSFLFNHQSIHHYSCSMYHRNLLNFGNWWISACISLSFVSTSVKIISS